MSIVCLMAFVLIGQEQAKDLPLDRQWQRAVEIKAEPIKLGADRVEIVTIRLNIKPNHYVYATPQPDETFQRNEMNLVIKSKDPKIQVEVKYPKGVLESVGSFRWTRCEGDVSIVAAVRRPKVDDSPLECTLRFHPSENRIPMSPARAKFTLSK